MHDLALAVLRSNEREYSLEGELLDCITSYNCVLLQEQGSGEMLVVRPDEASSKQFVYFTFYSKLMEIVQ